jgi:hypothetical protein
MKEEQVVQGLNAAGEENERQTGAAGKIHEDFMKSVEPSLSFTRIIARFVQFRHVLTEKKEDALFFTVRSLIRHFFATKCSCDMTHDLHFQNQMQPGQYH